MDIKQRAKEIMMLPYRLDLPKGNKAYLARVESIIKDAISDELESVAKMILEIDNFYLGPQHRAKLAAEIQMRRKNGIGE